MERHHRIGRFGPLALSLALVAACVTINIYFPAEKVESVAGEIVDEIRNRQPSEGDKSAPAEKNSWLLDTLLALSSPIAWADEVTTVSNPTIRALKARMKERFAKIKPFYKNGLLIEGQDGYVSLGNTSGTDLKAVRDVKSLVAAENKDRADLYEEVARALDIDPGQVNRVAEIFAKEWQKPVR